MDKKPIKKGGESHKFMEKILTKLKMTKRGSDDKPGAPGKITSIPSIEFKAPYLEAAKVDAENIMQFSDQLEQYITYVEGVQQICYCIYDFPASLNTKLEKEATELRSLFRDVRAAAIDINRLKQQRQAVKQEKVLAAKNLKKLKDEEVKELESIIHAYAKPLYSKWETIKNSQKPEVLENFMNEVTGKHRAMEILQELITRKLNKLEKKHTATAKPFLLMKNISSTTLNNKIKTPDNNSNWNITPVADTVKIVQPSPERSTNRTAAERDILRVNRRKRQREIRDERRRQNIENSENNTGGLDLQLIPIDGLTNEFEEIVTPRPTITARTTPIVNIEYASDDDSVSLSSSDFIIENFVQPGNTEVQSDLQNEMRSVLQALFGEIRQIPQLGFSSRNRHNNSGNDLRSPRTASH